MMLRKAFLKTVVGISLGIAMWVRKRRARNKVNRCPYICLPSSWSNKEIANKWLRKKPYSCNLLWYLRYKCRNSDSLMGLWRSFVPISFSLLKLPPCFAKAERRISDKTAVVKELLMKWRMVLCGERRGHSLPLVWAVWSVSADMP